MRSTAALPSIAHRVARRLQELRRDAELTQAELSRRTGIHRPIISRIERGKHEADLTTVARIAKALDLDVATILVCLDDAWCEAGRAERRRMVAEAGRGAA